jgi:tetratricopeptide (TPR) repeat protein
MSDGNDSLHLKRVKEFATTARRIASEREAAVNVEPLLRRTPADQWSQLITHPDLQTAGALERLASIVANAHTRDPKHALAVAQLAVAVAESLPEDAYPRIVGAQLRAHAWKDLGKSFRFLGRYDEALQALQTAERTVRTFGTLSHDLAIVQVNVAVVLQETNQYDASLDLLTKCKKVFREHGDVESFVQCGLLEGLLLQRLRRYREAREAYLLLLASTRTVAKETLAALHHNIGFCSVDLDDYPEAEANLTHAIALYRELGQSINALKAELGRGKLFLRLGEFAQAVSHLRPVRREFLRNSLAEEAGLCGLEIVEALLVLERAGEAEQLARKIVHEFTTAALSTRAITALSYLSEAITTQRASASMAHEVHEYILSLRTEPEREFSNWTPDVLGSG